MTDLGACMAVGGNRRAEPERATQAKLEVIGRGDASWVGKTPEETAYGVLAAADAKAHEELAASWTTRDVVEITWEGERFAGSPASVVRNVRRLDREIAAQQDYGNVLQLVHAMVPKAQGLWSGKPWWEPGHLVFLYVAKVVEVPRDPLLGRYPIFRKWRVDPDITAWGGRFTPMWRRWVNPKGPDHVGGRFAFVGLLASRPRGRSGPFGGLRYDIVGVVPIPRPFTIAELCGAIGRKPRGTVQGLQNDQMLAKVEAQRLLTRWLLDVKLHGHPLRDRFEQALEVLEDARTCHVGRDDHMAQAVHQRWPFVDPTQWDW